MTGPNWLARRVNEPGPIAARITNCEHQWEPIGTDRIRCDGPCGVVAAGTLTDHLTRAGMDWDRAVLVTPGTLNLSDDPERWYEPAFCIDERDSEAAR